MNLVGEFLILSERVVVDAFSQHVSVQHCLETLQASEFPSFHSGFGIFSRYRVEGPTPEHATGVDFRLVRVSEADGEEVIAEYPGTWAAGSKRARIATNFRLLRLKRPEQLLFRVDHRLQGTDWVPGPTCALDIEQAKPTRDDGATPGAE